LHDAPETFNPEFEARLPRQVSKTISDEQRPAGVIISKGKLWRFFANLRKDLNIREEQILPEERRPKND
jgi:hypothetical protein